MKKNEKMQSNQNVSSKNNSKITNRSNNNVTNKSNNVTNSNKKSVGFVSDSDSFELDQNNEHSFELRDCK